MSARESLYYGGSKSRQRKAATSVEKNLRQVRRSSAVQAYKQRGPNRISAKQQEIALRTMARNATSASDWKTLQQKSDTGIALPDLGQNISRNRSTESQAPKQTWTVGRGGGAMPAAAQSKDKMSVGEAWGWLVKDIASVKIPKPLQDANRALLKVMPAGEAIYQAQKLMGTDKQIGVAPIDLIPLGGVAAREGRYALRAGGRLLRRSGKTVEIGAKEAKKLSSSGARVVEVPKVKPTPKPKPKPEPTAIKRPLARVEDATTKAKATARTKVESLPKPARIGVKAATWPIRGKRKIAKLAAVGTGINVAGQVPAAATSGDLGKLIEPVTDPTKGVLGPAARQVAAVAPGRVAENFINDLFELPISIIPSIFLTGKAVVQAGQGDSEMLDAMVKDYVENGFLPNVAKGNLVGARRAFEQHPLYAALTVRGVYTGVGRSAGIAARSGVLGKTAKKAGSTKRADLKVNSTQSEEQRYSPNIFTKGVQAAIEKNKVRKGVDPNHVLNKTGGRIRQQRLEQRAAVHEVTAQEGARRANRAQAAVVTLENGKEKPLYKLTPKSLRNVSVLFIQGEVRRADTWREDLTNYRDLIRAEAADARASGRWSVAEQRRNAGLIRDIGIALRKATDADAERMIGLRDEFVNLQGPGMATLVKKGAYAKEQFLTARARPFAVAHMKARWNDTFDNGPGKKPGALVDPQGKKISLAQIEAQMAKEGVTPGFISHKPGVRGAKGNYYQPLSFIAGRRGNLGNNVRTGKASARGTFDATIEAAVEQLTGTRTLADRLAGFDRILSEFVVRDARTGKPRYFKNMNEGRLAANDPESFGLPTDTKLRPVRITPVGSKTAERDSAIRFLENTDRAGDDIASLEKLDQQAVARLETDGPGEIVLVPDKIFTMVEAFAKPQRTAGKVIASLTNAFKGVILPVSPRWLLGNVIDPALRSLLAGLTPVDWIVGRKVLGELEKLDPELRKRVDAVLTGGMQYGAAAALEIKRSQADQWGDSWAATLGLESWLRLRNAPGPKTVGNAYARYRELAYRKNSQWFERQPQIAALGKESRRRLGDVNGNWKDSLGLGQRAYEDLAKGLTDTKAQRAYAASIERVFGSWNRLSPGDKDFLGYYVPFGLWIRAAYQYVAITLPVHHPIKVAIGVQLAQMTEQERQQLGLSLTLDKRLPDYLQGSIPLGGGAALPIQAFTSFGMFSGVPTQLARSVLPQFEGLRQGLQGVDWLGNELVSKDGKVLTQQEKLALAIANLAEVTIPTIGLGFRLVAGSNFTELFAVPPYKRDKEPASQRLRQWSGISPTSNQELRDAMKWRQSYSIGVPGVPDIGQKEDKKKGGGGIVRVVP